MARPQGVNIAGTIVPTDDADTFPVIDPIWGIDGFRTVVDHATRNAIGVERRRDGMVVWTQNTNGTDATSAMWQLLPPPWAYDDTDWIELGGFALPVSLLGNPTLDPNFPTDIPIGSTLVIDPGGALSQIGAFVCYPAQTILTGPNQGLTLTIYQCQGGNQAVFTTAILYNYLGLTIQAGDGVSTRGVMCAPDGAGNFIAIYQSPI